MAAAVYNIKNNGSKMAAGVNNIKKDGGRRSIILKNDGHKMACV